MTQMGLDYMKHNETMRHNLQTEQVEQRKADIEQHKADTSRMDARTRQYTASFEDRRVAATEATASAATANAATNRLNYNLDATYRERETVAKEQTAAAQSKNADTQAIKVNNDTLLQEAKIIQDYFKYIPESMAQYLAAQEIKGEELTASEAATLGFADLYDVLHSVASNVKIGISNKNSGGIKSSGSSETKFNTPKVTVKNYKKK